MARLEILDAAARQEFERPPRFQPQQQGHFFAIPDWLQLQVNGFNTVINQVGFVLQWGYFKATGRFFKTLTYNPADVVYVSQQLNLAFLELDFKHYRRNTLGRHRQIIREALGFAPFTGASKLLIQQEARHLVKRQVHPERVFWNVCTFTRAHRIEVPTYYSLCELISEAIRHVEQRLDQALLEAITSEQALLLDELFEKLPADASGRSIHQLARLKNAQELMRLSVIRHNLSLLKDLKKRYRGLLPLLTRLNLSEEMIEYYAEYVLRADVFQVKRRLRRQLILCCFVSYQYFHLSDILLQTFLQATALACSRAEEKRDARILALQQENLVQVEAILASYLSQADFVRQIQGVAFSLDQTKDEKYVGWMGLM